MEFRERTHRFFDLAAAAQVYEQRGLSADSFWELVQQTLDIRALEIAELDWLLFDHVLSSAGFIPLTVHFEALAAGHGMPFEGIEDLHVKLIDAEILPPWILNRTHFHHIPQRTSDLGQILVGLGLLAEPTLRRAEDIKAFVVQKTGVDPSIGQVLRSVASLSTVDFFQVMGLRLHIPFHSLDESAPEIYESSVARRTGTFHTHTLLGRDEPR